MINDALDKVTNSRSFVFVFGLLLIGGMWGGVSMFRADYEAVDTSMELIENILKAVRIAILTTLELNAKYVAFTFPFFSGCSVGTLYGAWAREGKQEWRGVYVFIIAAALSLTGLAARSFWSF